MKLPRWCLAALSVILLPMVGHAAPDGADRAEAACWLGLGRAMTEDERSALTGSAGATTGELLERYRAQLRGDEAARRVVAVRACWDAFGRAPAAAETENGSGGLLYAERLAELAGGLAAQPREYQAVLERAYCAALGRPPFPEELDYWRGREPLAYLLVLGCLENWARRNAPGLTVTSGVPAIAVTSDRLATRRLSPALADEVRRALTWPVDELARARGANVLVPGAATIVSVGGVHFLALGRAGR